MKRHVVVVTRIESIALVTIVTIVVVMICILLLVWGNNIICLLGDAVIGIVIVIRCAVVVVISRCFDSVSFHVFVLFINGVYSRIFRDSIVVVFSGRRP